MICQFLCKKNDNCGGGGNDDIDDIVDDDDGDDCGNDHKQWINFNLNNDNSDCHESSNNSDNVIYGPIQDHVMVNLKKQTD